MKVRLKSVEDIATSQRDHDLGMTGGNNFHRSDTKITFCDAQGIDQAASIRIGQHRAERWRALMHPYPKIASCYLLNVYGKNASARKLAYGS